MNWTLTQINFQLISDLSGEGMMKAYVLVAVACAGALIAPAVARDVKVGEASSVSETRDKACQGATDTAWKNGASKVGDCRCHSITDEYGPGQKCLVFAYAYQQDTPVYDSPYRGNNSSGGNIYNNPYGGTTTVLPGVR